MKTIPIPHPRPTRAARRPAAALLAAVAVSLLLPGGCKSPTSPNGAGEADITVISRWSDPVDVYMDGVFRFPLGYKDYAEIDNVALKNHEMEARSQVTGETVAQTTLEVTEKTDYTWTIEHLARINCANAFGETLQIFMDGLLQFNLAWGENRWIIGVPLGDHLLAAYKVSDGQEAASKTLKVTENKDYVWAISIIKSGAPVVITGK